MNILIVDDEALGLARLERMLTTLGYDSITQASNATTALKAVKEQRFDVALLDINMPQTNGLELGYELRFFQEDLAIIFQTGYSDHALEAFDLGAVGYLVKPFSIDQLTQTLQRVHTDTQTDDSKQLRLLSKNGDEYYLLRPDEIYYIKADLSEVMFRTKEGFSYYTQKISDLEKRLEPYNFVRIHRSYLVNIDTIKSMHTIEQSKLRFNFEGIKDEIDSSKDGAKLFRQKFSHA